MLFPRTKAGAPAPYRLGSPTMFATSPTPRRSYRNGRLNCPAGAGAAPLHARNIAARNHSSTLGTSWSSSRRASPPRSGGFARRGQESAACHKVRHLTSRPQTIRRDLTCYRCFASVCTDGLGRLIIVSPDPRPSWSISGRNRLIVPAGFVQSSLADLIGHCEWDVPMMREGWASTTVANLVY